MSYKSPIEVYIGELQIQQEGAILTAIQDCGIKVDKHELTQALAYDRNQYEQGYLHGSRAFNRHIIEGIQDEITDIVETLISAWNGYNSELFMRGKIEGAELVFNVVKRVLAKTIENYSDVEETNE